MADVRDFTCDFHFEVNHLHYNEADVKDVFNICPDQPLSLREMEKLAKLGI